MTAAVMITALAGAVLLAWAATSPFGATYAGTRQPARILTVAAIMAAALAAATAITDPRQSAVVLLLTAVGGPLALIDLNSHRLPNPFTAGLLAAGLVLALIQLPATGWTPMAIATAGCVFAAATGLALAVGRGMGVGDAKLLAALTFTTAWLSWPTAVTGILLGLILNGVAALTLLVTRRAARSQRIPMGPGLILGALAAALLA